MLSLTLNGPYLYLCRTNYIPWWVTSMKFLIIQFSPLAEHGNMKLLSLGYDCASLPNGRISLRVYRLAELVRHFYSLVNGTRAVRRQQDHCHANCALQRLWLSRVVAWKQILQQNFHTQLGPALLEIGISIKKRLSRTVSEMYIYIYIVYTVHNEYIKIIITTKLLCV
jgi:hypothetical protein